MCIIARNSALNLWRIIILRKPVSEPIDPYRRPYPIVTVHNYLQKCIGAGIISPNQDIEDITTDIRMIVIGNVFECAERGTQI